jgi:hypothetical protein
MSVQAHDGAYCTPREGDAERYTEVELGCPSEREDLIMDWIEVPDGNPTESIYPYIPVDVVTTVIVKHGGMVEGEVPPGVIAVPALK